MATISIIRFIFVLPVPVSPFSQILAKLMKIKPSDTILITGIPSSKKVVDCPNSLKNTSGNKFKIEIIKMHKPKLHKLIFLITGITISSLFCPIKLDTMVLLVPANAQTKTPANPNTFLMVLLIAFAIGPLVSIKRKNTSQVVKLKMNCNTKGNAILYICALMSLSL